MRFFFDACIAPRIAQSIAVLAAGNGQVVEHLTARFDTAIPDVEWIKALKEEGSWVVVSADPRISRNRIEQAAWQESGLTAFFFADFARRRFWDQAEEIVRRWPDIVLKADRCRVGSGFLVRPRDKAFHLIYEPA